MSISLDSKTTALVLIDLQGGVVGRDLAPYPASDVVAKSAELAATFRSHGAPVIYVRVLVTDMYPLPADQSWPRPTGDLAPSVSEIVPEAGFQAGDYLVTKRQWGAFYGTELDQILFRRNIRTIVLGGIATSFGVESTARAAFDHGYELVFAEDITSNISADGHKFVFENIFPRMGRVRAAEEITAGLV